MRCPKCHYVSFEREPRCRHCGYGFTSADARVHADEVSSSPRPPDTPLTEAAPAHANRLRSAAAVAEPRWEAELVRPEASSTTELPLFVKVLPIDRGPAAGRAMEAGEDEPLVRVPLEPRVPLSVRRPAPDASVHRVRAQARPGARKLGPLDRDLLEDLQRIEKTERRDVAAAEARAQLTGDRVGAPTRLAAAALDALLIGGMSAAVLWVTLRWCDLAFDQAIRLPLLPTLAFHGLVGLGYLLMFTAAGGQTLGKMAFGLRVVGDGPDAGTYQAVTIQQAAYRAILSLPSVLAFGAGFIPALLGTQRALHDRLAHTRVVRA